MTAAAEDEDVLLGADGKRYLLAPLTLGQIKRLKPLLAAFNGGEDAEDAAAEIIAMALKRHAPDMTAEAALDIIEFRHVTATIFKIVAMSGIAAEGEAAAG